MESNLKLILGNDTAQFLLGTDGSSQSEDSHVSAKLERLIYRERENLGRLSVEVAAIANASLLAFIQTNVTGPPLKWDPSKLIPPKTLLERDEDCPTEVSRQLAAWLAVDGEAVYRNIPYIELFVFAKLILNAQGLKPTQELLHGRLRVNAWHQRLLDQPASSLQAQIEEDLHSLEPLLYQEKQGNSETYAEYLLERSALNILHGRDADARIDLERAAQVRHFQYTLTGKLGKRTKYQEKNISQLIVLAKSFDPSTDTLRDGEQNAVSIGTSTKPRMMRLEDDTLLETIAFPKEDETKATLQNEESFPSVLLSLDAGNQPLLHPLDAIVLLDLASSITNESPQDGLTREETLPYAERVLSGGSPNWQVYTQALLVRSRIESYKTRTLERSLLQLQAVVDQVIADTSLESSEDAVTDTDGNAPNKAVNTFISRPKEVESAPVDERLKYIHQIGSPPRWRLEAELANRWVSVGGLRTALEIYERLQMWAEVALCWAASGHEDKARQIVARQLYQHKEARGNADSREHVTDESIQMSENLVDSLPIDAPRLFCILGDLDNSPEMYEKAWEISKKRFARAKRSLGKFYMNKGDFERADDAYSSSLDINPQNHETWFSLGCVRLQIENWSGAVEAFGRAVQIEDSDAESWSNMAIALLKLPAEDTLNTSRLKSAFIAIKKATSLKRESSKLWQNYLAIAIKLDPLPSSEIILAQTRLVDLLGKSQGESAVDIGIVGALIAFAFGSEGASIDRKDGQTSLSNIQNQVANLVFQKIAPLVTSSRALWLLIARLNLHLQRPYAALSTYEKAWRSALNQPGWESSKKLWKTVSEATVDLLDAYESLGDRLRESGLGVGEPVCPDWKFKARSAARSVLARAKEAWEDEAEYNQIKQRLDDMKR